MADPTTYTRRIRTFLYDDQRFSDAELDLLHTPTLQRLYDLHQLGFTDRVFVDASHTRFSHVVGSMEQADRLLSAIRQNLLRHPNHELVYSKNRSLVHISRAAYADLLIERWPAARLMALLHDVTHAPYGHTLEDEIGIVASKHDDPARQADVFMRLLADWIGWQWLELHPTTIDKHQEVVSQLFDKYFREADFFDTLESFPQYSELIKATIHAGAILASARRPVSVLSLGSSQIRGYLKHLQFAFRALVNLDFLHSKDAQESDRPRDVFGFDQVINGILSHEDVNEPLSEREEFTLTRDACFLDIIGNTICADLLDYALRDAKLAGVHINYDSLRIVENFTLVSYELVNDPEDDSSKELQHPLMHLRMIRAAVALFYRKFRPDIAGELISLLDARYYVYERMLFHPTKCVAGATLGAAIQWIGWRRLPAHFRRRGDAVFLNEMREAANLALHYLSLSNEKALTSAFVVECEAKILDLPPVGSLRACISLLKDLLPSAEAITERLSCRKRLARWLSRARDVLPAFERLVTSGEVSRDRIFTQLVREFPEHSGDIETLVREEFPSVEELRARITAGITLLDRLMARRYPRRVFNLLSGDARAGMPKQSLLAKTFKNPVTRQLAEREIERRLGLPTTGRSVVIHCPSADGPGKIANVLITYGDFRDGDKSSAVRLFNVNNLGGDVPKEMFLSHADVIKAIQGMYRSTWRLSVSVARSDDEKAFEEDFDEVVGGVLHEIVSSGESVEPLKNDPSMTRELELSRLSSSPSLKVVVMTDNGTVETLPAASYRAMHVFLEEAQKIPAVARYIDDMQLAATSSDPSMVDKASALRSFLAQSLSQEDQRTFRFTEEE